MFIGASEGPQVAWLWKYELGPVIACRKTGIAAGTRSPLSFVGFRAAAVGGAASRQVFLGFMVQAVSGL